MKKLRVIVFISAALMVLLVALAFFYVDMSGHREFRYVMSVRGRAFGSVKVDRYVTEDKVVYKSSAKYPYSLEYRSVNEKLFLKKKTMTPLRFLKESEGLKGQKQLTVLVQDGETIDVLFLEHPRFITLKGFETGRKTMVFSPDDIMSYMPVMEKYNFWRRGSQFFEVMVPVDEPMPPMRDKIEVKYLGDEYIPVMGRRMEAEIFSVKARALPEAKVFLSKYTHRILALEIEKMDTRFALLSRVEGSGKGIRSAVNGIVSLLVSGKAAGKPQAEDEDLSAESGPTEAAAAPAGTAPREEARVKEVFFESDNLILSGRSWMPDGEGPFPAVVIVPKDGPMANGEQHLVDSLGEFLSASGFAVLAFDSPGQGKSQGSFKALDDEKKIRNITDAVSYLEARPAVKKGSISLIGHEGGGYLAMKAASDLPSVRSCVLLGAPRADVETVFSGAGLPENIQTFLDDRGLGPFDERFMEMVAEKVQKHLEAVARSTEGFAFFKGVKIPLKAYREFLARRPYEAILSFDRPLLLIFGKDDKYFNPKATGGLKRALKKKNRGSRVATFKNLGDYAGGMIQHGSSWRFSINKDAFEHIRSWIVKNGIRDEEASPEVKAGEPAASDGVEH